MKTIKTEILINAPRNRVWKMLTDFNSYPSWNPFIKQLNGSLINGSYLDVMLHIEGRNPMRFKPIVMSAISGEKFCWRGRLFFRGLFDGTHYFILEETEEGFTRLIHGENFSGILAAILFGRIREGALSGFEKMNQALKTITEQ